MDTWRLSTWFFIAWTLVTLAGIVLISDMVRTRAPGFQAAGFEMLYLGAFWLIAAFCVLIVRRLKRH
jgi:hypothetical protein